MPFRLSNEVKAWFKGIRDSSFETDFDSFYFSFMAGITAGKKKKVATADTNELVGYDLKQLVRREEVPLGLDDLRGQKRVCLHVRACRDEKVGNERDDEERYSKAQEHHGEDLEQEVRVQGNALFVDLP